MTAKEYLSQSRTLNKLIKDHLAMIENLKQMEQSIPGPNYDTELVDHTRSYEAPFLKFLLKRIDLEKQVEVEKENLVDLQSEVASVIASVKNPLYQSVLSLRYIACKTWQEVAFDLDCSLDNVYRVHRNALKEVKIPE